MREEDEPRFQGSDDDEFTTVNVKSREQELEEAIIRYRDNPITKHKFELFELIQDD